MQTSLVDPIKDTPDGREADQILRTCVHCGFCLATCPTYQVLGDELDSPRGRIYLVKQMLEGRKATHKTQLHLDRCLTCRACETTCPSGVNYHRLADIGRDLVSRRVRRPLHERLLRTGLRTVLPYRSRFTPLLRLGQRVRGLLPAQLRRSIPPRRYPGLRPAARHARRMLILEGCVQPGIAPNINAASARVLDRLGISLIDTPKAGCCGTLSYHLDAQQEGMEFMRRNIDAWWPAVAAGAEAVVTTTTACGAALKEYSHLFRHTDYAAKAQRISELTRDIGEILNAEDLAPLGSANGRRIAFHSPCSLQHGQRLSGVVERVLRRLDYTLTPVPDPHLCCGSAGTHPILHPDIALALRTRKLQALHSGEPEVIATANIGCLTHLQSGTDKPVRHWIELVDELAG